MNFIESYSIPLLFALLVHAVVVVLIGVNWADTTTIHSPDIQLYYIEALLVPENPYEAKKKREAARTKSAWANKLLQRRQVEDDLRRQQAEWEAKQKRRQEAKAAVLVENLPLPDRKPLAEKTPVDQGKLSREFEQGLALALINEQNMKKAVTDDEKAMAYVAQIQREIIQNWSRPPSARNGMEALLRVILVPTGEVVDVQLEKSSGNEAFDRSAMLSVRKVRRFMVPADSRRFERDFREFTVLFRPDDLRL